MIEFLGVWKNNPLMYKNKFFEPPNSLSKYHHFMSIKNFAKHKNCGSNPQNTKYKIKKNYRNKLLQ